VVLLDYAGWHTSTKLKVPANISLHSLPPKAPELNPQENDWQVSARQLALQRRVRFSTRYRQSLL
jgi:hypothetical protein